MSVATVVCQVLMVHNAYTDAQHDVDWLRVDTEAVLEALAAGSPVEDALIDTGWACVDFPGDPERAASAASAIRIALGIPGPDF